MIVRDRRYRPSLQDHSSSAARHGPRSSAGYRTWVCSISRPFHTGCPGGGQPKSASSRGVEPSTNTVHSMLVDTDCWVLYAIHSTSAFLKATEATIRAPEAEPKGAPRCQQSDR